MSRKIRPVWRAKVVLHIPEGVTGLYKPGKPFLATTDTLPEAIRIVTDWMNDSQLRKELDDKAAQLPIESRFSVSFFVTISEKEGN